MKEEIQKFSSWGMIVTYQDISGGMDLSMGRNTWLVHGYCFFHTKENSGSFPGKILWNVILTGKIPCFSLSMINQNLSLQKKKRFLLQKC